MLPLPLLLCLLLVPLPETLVIEKVALLLVLEGYLLHVLLCLQDLECVLLACVLLAAVVLLCSDVFGCIVLLVKWHSG